MAVSLAALLSIKANTTGEGAVRNLAGAIQGVQAKAVAATGGLKALTGAAGMGGLAGAMSTLTPLLSAAGLVGMAKSALDGGAAMYDMAQKTGVSVTTLAKFKKAAATSGTDLDTVAKSVGKLSKGLVEAATKGTGPTADALKRLGISATDASGKVRSADAVMLDIATKFKAMPDGVGKTAAAIALFGRSGAEMIPMLNMGGDAIDKLKVKMTDAFAKRANEYKDSLTALSGKVGSLGADIMIALLPSLQSLTNALTGAVDAFNKLPEPLRNLVALVGIIAIAWGPLTALFTGLVGIIGSIGPAVAGVGAAFVAVGPFFTGLAATIAGFITWPVLLVAALVAAAVAIFVFRDKIGAFFQAIGKLIADWVASLWEWGEPIRKFWISIWDGLVDFAGPNLKALYDFVGETFSAMLKLVYQVFFEPYVKAWERLQAVGGILVKSLQDAWSGFASWIGGVFRAIGDTFSSVFVKPITNAFKFVVDTGKAALRGLLQWGANVVNSIIRSINGLIQRINPVLKAAGLGTFGQLSLVQVPAFAEGGYVTGPTLGLIGEAGREYVVPERKAAAFASNYLAGGRGAATLSGRSGAGGGGGASPAVQVGPLSITTGPLMQMDGKRFVGIEDLERAVQEARRQAAGDVLRQLRTPGGRRAIGVA